MNFFGFEKIFMWEECWCVFSILNNRFSLLNKRRVEAAFEVEEGERWRKDLEEGHGMWEDGAGGGSFRNISDAHIAKSSSHGTISYSIIFNCKSGKSALGWSKLEDWIKEYSVKIFGNLRHIFCLILLTSICF